MSRLLTSALLSFPLCMLLAGCGYEKHEVTNEFYHPEHPVTSKTLYPKTQNHAMQSSTENLAWMKTASTHKEKEEEKPAKSRPTPAKPDDVSHQQEGETKRLASVQMKQPNQTPFVTQRQAPPAQREKTEIPKVKYTLPVPPKPVEPIDVQKEIAKTLEAVERIKAEAAKQIAEALRIIKIVKPIRATKVMPVVPSVVDVVKAEAVAEVAEATAFAQTAEAVAKAKIAKAVAKVQIAELNDATKPATKEEVRQAKAKSAKKIAQAVAAAEIAKAKAAATVAKSVAEVEKQKAKKYPSLAEKLFGEK